MIPRSELLSYLRRARENMARVRDVEPDLHLAVTWDAMIAVYDTIIGDIMRGEV